MQLLHMTKFCFINIYFISRNNFVHMQSVDINATFTTHHQEVEACIGLHPPGQDFPLFPGGFSTFLVMWTHTTENLFSV